MFKVKRLVRSDRSDWYWANGKRSLQQPLYECYQCVQKHDVTSSETHSGKVDRLFSNQWLFQLETEFLETSLHILFPIFKLKTRIRQVS